MQSELAINSINNHKLNNWLSVTFSSLILSSSKFNLKNKVFNKTTAHTHSKECLGYMDYVCIHHLFLCPIRRNQAA